MWLPGVCCSIPLLRERLSGKMYINVSYQKHLQVYKPQEIITQCAWNKLLQSATKWVETLRPKWTFWRFPDFKRGKDNVSSPIPSMQCCATVRATFRKQETSQLWMEGTGEGCGFLCFWSYPVWVQCLNNFVVDCSSMISICKTPLNNLFPTLWSKARG